MDPITAEAIQCHDVHWANAAKLQELPGKIVAEVLSKFGIEFSGERKQTKTASETVELPLSYSLMVSPIGSYHLYRKKSADGKDLLFMSGKAPALADLVELAADLKRGWMEAMYQMAEKKQPVAAAMTA